MQFLSLVKELLRPAAIQTSIISDTLTKTECQPFVLCAQIPQNHCSILNVSTTWKKKLANTQKQKKDFFDKTSSLLCLKKMAANRS